MSKIATYCRRYIIPFTKRPSKVTATSRAFPMLVIGGTTSSFAGVSDSPILKKLK